MPEACGSSNSIARVVEKDWTTPGHGEGRFDGFANRPPRDLMRSEGTREPKGPGECSDAGANGSRAAQRTFAQHAKCQEQHRTQQSARGQNPPREPAKSGCGDDGPGGR